MAKGHIDKIIVNNNRNLSNKNEKAILHFKWRRYKDVISIFGLYNKSRLI